jgi:GNAT superfamily N-acetyltransferase
MTQSDRAATPLLTAFVRLTTRTGLDLYVRPVSPEDADQLKAFLASLTPEDLRFRFLTPVSKPGGSLLETLVSVDHVETEDYLAFADGEGGKELVASAMLAADAAMDRAEVAIAIRPGYKQRGVGWTLLDFVAREAASKGIKTLESIECDDNRAAIALEKEMGFTARPYPGDATLTLVCKTLGRPPAADIAR